jgi:hypothetical protein
MTIGVADNTAFAQLNSLATTTLRQAAALPAVVNLVICAYMARDSFEDLSSKRTDEGTTPVRFKVNINISGSSLDGELIGEILSKRDLFLQDPLQREECIPYENPHVWALKTCQILMFGSLGLRKGSLPASRWQRSKAGAAYLTSFRILTLAIWIWTSLA